VPFNQELPKYFRRLKTRIKPREEVWVYWRCDDRDEFSRINNICLGGIFIETPKRTAVGVTTKINFLAQEGTIKAEAAVCHVKPSKGLGLKFTAVSDSNRHRLEALINRLSLK
jgi:hypothetical protein